MTGKLYLIPTGLGDNAPLEVLPLSIKKVIENLEKGSRRFGNGNGQAQLKTKNEKQLLEKGIVRDNTAKSWLRILPNQPATVSGKALQRL